MLTCAYTAAGPRTMIAPQCGGSSSCAWLGRASITATTTSMDALPVGHLAGGGGLVSASAVHSDEWATRGADLTGLADISCGGNVCVARKTDDTADTVESSLVASADPPAVSARAPSRRRQSKRKRQQVGESLSRFDPRAEYIDSIYPHGHTVCVAFFMVDLAAAVTPLNDDGAYNNRGAPGSIFKAVIHTGLRGRGRVGFGERLRRLLSRTIPYIVA